MSYREILSAIRATNGTVPEVRGVRRKYSSQLRELSGDAMLVLATKLARTGNVLARFAGYELVRFHPAAFALLDANVVIALGEGMDSWDAVDAFGSIISGPAWKRDQIRDALVISWARAKDRWWRRAALVSTVTLNRKPPANDHVQRTLEICATLVDDRDDMIVKALSWALRELSKANADAVRRFVNDHHESLAPRVKREVGNKLTRGTKR